jgi:hypothetical protein
MSKKLVFICDAKECGAVLVNPGEGFVLTGAIRSTTVEGTPAALLEASTTDELSFCRDCFAKALGLHP